MVEVATYTLPVYEAVVCGLTLAQLKEQESEQREREQLTASFNCVDKIQTAIRMLREGDFSKVSQAEIKVLALSLTVAIPILGIAVEHLRNSLDTISEPYRAAQSDVIVKLKDAIEALQEIAEAWCIALDARTSSEIREALSSLKGGEVSPWREVLATVKD
jgi:hypothetical protein